MTSKNFLAQLKLLFKINYDERIPVYGMDEAKQMDERIPVYGMDEAKQMDERIPVYGMDEAKQIETKCDMRTAQCCQRRGR